MAKTVEAEMPNFVVVSDDEQDFQANVLPFLEKVMAKLGLGGEAVVTFIPRSIVYSLDGKRENKPYIILRETDPEEARRIVEQLKESNLRMDVEVEHIDHFFPKEMMQPNISVTLDWS